MAVSCSSKPLWELMVENTFAWLGCPTAEYAGGMVVVGLFLYLTTVTIMLNWTESWPMPTVWSTIYAAVFLTVVPAEIATRVMALVTIGVAVAVIYVWDNWRDR